MKYINLFVKYLFICNILNIQAFVTNANFVISSEQKVFSELLDNYNLPCHIQTVRVKSFQSALQKIKKIEIHNKIINKQNKQNKQNNNGYIPRPINKHINDIYDLYDLIGFKFVFYTVEDLLKFYYHFKFKKTVYYTKNYIMKPKENGYSSIHIRYKNDYSICPVKQLECQLYTIEDYYEAMYGKARYSKNYTVYF